MSRWRRDRSVVGAWGRRGVVVLAGIVLGCTAGAAPALASTDVLSIAAGTGTAGAPTPGPATSSALNSPEGVAVDAAGNFYFADIGNHEVDKVTPSGILSVIAGTGNPPMSVGAPTPGPATSANLDFPIGVAVDAAGNVYIADNQEKVIDKVTPSGTLSIFAGTGSGGTPVPGPATSSPLDNPDGVAVDAAGNVYIADNGALQIEKVTPSGTLSIFAGSGSYGAPTPGPATSSALKDPVGVGVDAAGNVYIADTGSHEVEKVTPSGTLSIVAGTGTAGAPVAGSATSSPLGSPSEVAMDAAGNLYISDGTNHEIEQVTPSGALSVFAGTGTAGAPAPGPPTSSPLGNVSGVAITSAGTLYIGDQTNNEIERVGLPPAAPTVTTPPSATSTPPSPTTTTTTTTTPTSPTEPVTTTSASCPATTVSLTGLRFGPVRLGMTRVQARRALLAYQHAQSGMTDSCQGGTAGKIGLGYPSSRLLTKLKAHQRGRLRGRVMLVLTTDSRYSLNQIKPGTQVADVRARLAHMRHLKIGRTTWYVVSGAHATGIIKVQHGTVQGIGIANRALTRTHAAQRRLLARF
jgi:sugar lactone lactonase YvrE